MSLDLHVHSTFSDGTKSPAELVAMARERGLVALSITDHDTTEGTDEALAAGTRHGLEVVPGIEISVVHGESHLHLLGYYIDHRHRALQQLLSELQQDRRNRNTKIIETLQLLGAPITAEDVAVEAGCGETGRPHIARALMRKGLVSSIDEAFTRFLARGAPAYHSRRVLSAAEGIRLIQLAGGVSVLAHPATIDNSLRKIPALVAELTACGLDGIEVYYPAHSRKNRKQLSSLASRYGLVVTGGSDYHGDIRPGTMLAGGANVHVPSALLGTLQERWRRAVSKRQGAD